MNSLLSRITQTPGQCGGRPCIRGMRIRVSDILEMLAENVSTSEILEDFPDLEMADIQACLVFAARRTDFSRLTAWIFGLMLNYLQHWQIGCRVILI